MCYEKRNEEVSCEYEMESRQWRNIIDVVRIKRLFKKEGGWDYVIRFTPSSIAAFFRKQGKDKEKEDFKYYFELVLCICDILISGR